jgi:hypothetical protein
MKRKSVIAFEALPVRAKNLDLNTMSKVFGGCQLEGQGCGLATECCPGLRCVSHPWDYKGVSQSAIIRCEV